MLIINDNIKECLNFLKNQLNSNFIIFLGVSGGSDSILVYNLLKTFIEINNDFSKKQLIVLHYNHKTRKETDEEEKLLKEICKKDKIKIIIGKNLVKTHNEKILRQNRYEFFTKNIIKYNNGVLVLGHNLDDRIETTLLNMMRGSSLNGFINMSKNDLKTFILSGKKYKYNILRPLLDIPKNIINNICQHNSIQYFVDKSNFDITVSKRNYIRQVINSITKESNFNNDISCFYKSFLNIYNTFQIDNNEINYLRDIKLSKYLQYQKAYKLIKTISKINELIEILKQLGIYSNISKSLLSEIYNFIQFSKGGYVYKAGINIVKSHKQIYFLIGEKEFWNNSNSFNKKILKTTKIIKTKDFTLNISSHEYFGGVVRFFNKNDKINGKPISKIFIEKQIPIFWRNYIPLIEKNNKIIKIFYENLYTLF